MSPLSSFPSSSSRRTAAIGVYVALVPFLPITGMSLLSVWDKVVLFCFIPQELCALLATFWVGGFESETLLKATAGLLGCFPSLLCACGIIGLWQLLRNIARRK